MMLYSNSYTPFQRLYDTLIKYEDDDGDDDDDDVDDIIHAVPASV